MALTLRMVHHALPGTSSDGGVRSTTLRGLADGPEARREDAHEAPRAVARACPACDRRFSGESLFCPFDGDVLVEAPAVSAVKDPLIGQIIDDRYEVLSILGEGGMGTVYEVRHVTLERRFAVKVLRRDIADAEHTARFVREAKAAAAIGHPNIVAVSDFGELPAITPAAASTPFFVMELLKGESLAAILRTGEPLEKDRAIDLFVQIAEGLGAAHAAGVVHRDLKPDNIFLARSADRELVKLLDFGVAKMAGAGRLTRAGVVFGTPHYMSPEHASGQPIDHRADIYAFGVILYEALTGRVPFEADTYMGVLKRHMFEAPAPIDELVPNATEVAALSTIAMRCLEKDPASRFANMSDVSAALDAARSQPAVSRRSRVSTSASVVPGRASGAPDDLHAMIPKSRPAAPVLAGIMGVLAIGFAALLLKRAESSKAPQGDDASARAALATGASGASATTPSPPLTSPTPGATTPPVATMSPAPSAAPTLPASTAATASTVRGAQAAPSFRAPPVKAQPVKSPARTGDVVDPWGK